LVLVEIFECPFKALETEVTDTPIFFAKSVILIAFAVFIWVVLIDIIEINQ